MVDGASMCGLSYPSGSVRTLVPKPCWFWCGRHGCLDRAGGGFASELPTPGLGPLPACTLRVRTRYLGKRPHVYNQAPASAHANAFRGRASAHAKCTRWKGEGRIDDAFVRAHHRTVSAVATTQGALRLRRACSSFPSRVVLSSRQPRFVPPACATAGLCPSRGTCPTLWDTRR